MNGIHFFPVLPRCTGFWLVCLFVLAGFRSVHAQVPAVTIVDSPKDVAVAVGSSTELRVTAAGVQPLNYAWFLN